MKIRKRKQVLKYRQPEPRLAGEGRYGYSRLLIPSIADTKGDTMERDVTLSCDGKSVPLNDFTKAIVANIVTALVATLKKSDAEGEIVLKIGPGR
jgi:hypothetical protein